MADQKISELTALTGANVADDDAIAIVDTSATETKKIVFSELKNALDTATGFVRITGDTMTGALDVQSTITSDGLTVDGTATITTTGNETQLTLTSTDADATTGPNMAFFRNSSSAADGDQTGSVFFIGKDDAGNDTTYGSLTSHIVDASNTTEDGRVTLSSMKAGTLTDTLHVVSGSVGIGASLPSKKLSVQTSTAYDGALVSNTHSSSAARLQLNNDDSKSIQIDMGGSTQTTYGPYIANTAAIVANSAPLNIGTDSANHVGFYTALNERMRLLSTGSLLIGQSLNDRPAEFAQPTGASISGASGHLHGQYQSSVNGLTMLLNRKGSDGDIVSFRTDGADVGNIGSATKSGDTNIFIGNKDGDVGIYFHGATDSIDPINPGNGFDRNGAISLGRSGVAFKDLYLSGGIQFDSRSNKLDDYEEGVWTPTLLGGGTVSSTAGSVYTKVGNVVNLQMYMQMSGIPNNATPFVIGGLPFAASTSGGKQLHGHATITYINNVNGSTYGAGLPASNSTIYWHSKVNANQLTNSNFTGVTQLILAGFYYTA